MGSGKQGMFQFDMTSCCNVFLLDYISQYHTAMFTQLQHLGPCDQKYCISSKRLVRKILNTLTVEQDGVDMAALGLAPKQPCSMFCCCVISYIISPEHFLCYYIQLEITSGYQSEGNSPALRPGLDPLFVPPRAIELIPEAAPSPRWRRRGIRSGLLV
jgi:hypothetical protein